MCNRRLSRRTYLGAAATALTGAVAGCSDGSSDDPTDDSSTAATTTEEERLTPQASFSFSLYRPESRLTITHDAGDDIELSTVSVNVGTETAYEAGEFRNGYGDGPEATDWPDPVSAGDTLGLHKEGGLESGTEVRVIWAYDDQSAVIAEFEVP